MSFTDINHFSISFSYWNITGVYFVSWAAKLANWLPLNHWNGHSSTSKILHFAQKNALCGIYDLKNFGGLPFSVSMWHVMCCVERNVLHSLDGVQDYQLDIDQSRRRIHQQHMVQWIVDGVIKGITPQQVSDLHLSHWPLPDLYTLLISRSESGTHTRLMAIFPV